MVLLVRPVILVTSSVAFGPIVHLMLSSLAQRHYLRHGLEDLHHFWLHELVILHLGHVGTLVNESLPLIVPSIYELLHLMLAVLLCLIVADIDGFVLHIAVVEVDLGTSRILWTGEAHKGIETRTIVLVLHDLHIFQFPVRRKDHLEFGLFVPRWEVLDIEVAARLRLLELPVISLELGLSLFLLESPGDVEFLASSEGLIRLHSLDSIGWIEEADKTKSSGFSFLVSDQLAGSGLSEGREGLFELLLCPLEGEVFHVDIVVCGLHN